jgi:cyclic-di-AMP phosphodiesterase PgpH
MAHKLPEPIIRTILEHHGTSLVSYFHHKARSRIELDVAEGNESKPGNGRAKINENDFRYPGPKPRTLESVIICLADAVEAASRTIEKATPAGIEAAVNEITNGRIEDDQFSEADITLAELSGIKRSLIFNLSNMLHGRTPYPKDEDRDNQPAEADKAQRFENVRAG